MKKSFAAAGLAASLALGGFALGVPGVAGAAETATGAAGSVPEVLRGLVGGGTITQAQADAVQSALKDARAERGPGHHGRPGHVKPSVIAAALGVTPEELHTALRNDQTIAQLAQAKGVNVQTVISAIVTAEKAKVDAAVAAGKITQERADTALANAQERATAVVNGERPAFGGRGGPRR